ncbi:hypothetical protein IT414_04005 [bacterium]|nr:hypothetical protein [bacterium]
MSKLFKKKTGAASILVTIILSIVVVGMIAGLTLLSNQESRQASNTDQSNRALNGAQSKVQELAQQIAADPSKTFEKCNDFGDTGSQQPEQKINDAQGDVAVTCATVTNQGDSMSGQIDRDNTVQVDLSRVSDVRNLRLNWGLKGTDGAASGLPAAPNPYYPVLSAYGSRPATLELTFVWYGNVGDPDKFNASDFSGGSLPMKTILLSPSGCNPNPPAAMNNYQCGYPNANGTGYVDLATLGIPSGKNVVIRVTSRYTGTSYSMRFADSAGNPSNVRFPYAVIDVTARSGQTYRRVQATKPIEYTTFDFVSNVLYSGKNLCKTMQVYSDYSGAGPNAGKNDPTCEN